MAALVYSISDNDVIGWDDWSLNPLDHCEARKSLNDKQQVLVYGPILATRHLNPLRKPRCNGINQQIETESVLVEIGFGLLHATR
jgi:hypothetical protein